MRNKNDSDARTIASANLAAWAAARAGRTVGVRRAELERAEAAISTLTRDKTLGGSVFAAYERARSPVIFHVDADEIRPLEGGTGSDAAYAPVVLRDVRLTIGREDRVRLVGANGAGKTTLLGHFLASGPDSSRVLYLPQELTRVQVGELTSSLGELTPDVRGRVLSVFAALGSDPDRVAYRRGEDGSRLSPGEARKLALAMGLGRHVWALVLDEPTNHLDLPSIERVENALGQFPGAIVLVTHDDAFARACTTRALTVAEGVVR